MNDTGTNSSGFDLEALWEQIFGGDSSFFEGGERTGLTSALMFGGGNAAISDPSDLMEAMFSDMSRMQDAADESYQRGLDQEEQWENLLAGIMPTIEDQLIEVKDPAESEAYKRAQQEYERFVDTSAQNISAAAAGIQGRYQSSMNMVNTGRRPDGSLMTPAEKAAARHQLGGQMNNDIARAMAPMVDASNRQKAQLGMQAAGFLAQQEQLNIQAQQINAANILNGIQLQLQGRAALAQYVQQNQRSIVSTFQGLMALAQAGMDLDFYRDQNSTYHTFTGPTDWVEDSLEELLNAS